MNIQEDFHHRRPKEEGSGVFEKLKIAQEFIVHKKWRLRNLSKQRECAVEENSEYKKIEVKYTPGPQRRSSTEVLGEDKKYFDFEYFNGVQSAVLDSLYNTRENALISAPTGCGKTELAVLAILQEYRTYKKNCSVVILAPTKALIRELENTLIRRVGYILTVEQDTTDRVKDKEYYRSTRITDKNNRWNTNILITTPEKYDILTLKERIQPTLLIIDEIHTIGESRGGVLESVIIRSKKMKNIRIIGMSATVPNYSDVAEFINAKDTHSYYFNYTYREVPTTYSVLGVKEKRKLVDILMKQLTEKPTLIFINSRRECDEVAQVIREKIKKKESDVLSSILPYLSSIVPENETDKKLFISEINGEVELISAQIGVHHSGISKVMRKAVEILFKAGVLRVICCTSTLACGVNLPVDHIIIYKTKASGKNTETSYSLSEISQMSGRAGRKGLSVEGHITIITEVEKVLEYSRAVTFQFPIESRLGETLPVRILYEICTGKDDINSLVEWIEETYAYKRGMKHEETKEYFKEPSKIVLDVVEYLIKIGAVSVENEKSKTTRIKPTTLGTIAYTYYLDPMTAHRIFEIFKEIEIKGLEIDIGDLLLVISTAEDYKEIKTNTQPEESGNINNPKCSTEEKENKAIETLMKKIKYPIKHKETEIQKIIKNTAEIKEIVSVLAQAYVDIVVIDPSLYSTYNKIVISIERIVQASFAIGRLILNRSIYSILDLSKSLAQREWRYTKQREQLEVDVEIDEKTVVIGNPTQDKLFITISSGETYKFIYTAITSRPIYYYKITEQEQNTKNTYIIRIDSIDRFTIPLVEQRIV